MAKMKENQIARTRTNGELRYLKNKIDDLMHNVDDVKSRFADGLKKKEAVIQEAKCLKL